MPVNRDKRGRWVVEFQHRGVRVHRRCPEGVGKGEAEALEARLRTEIFAARELGVKPAVSLPHAVQSWLNQVAKHQKSYAKTKNRALAMAPLLIGKTLGSIPAIADELKKAESAAGTINRKLALLKAVAKFAFKTKGWTDENLSARIQLLPEDGAREVYLTKAQVKTLAAGMSTPAGRAAVILSAYTGLRKGELLRLTKANVHGHDIRLTRKTKVGKARTVPVPPSARAALDFVPFALKEGALDWDWRKARKAAGLKHVHWHDLRHTYASWLINEGVDLYTVAELLGDHIITAKRYAHLQTKTLTKAVARLR